MCRIQVNNDSREIRLSYSAIFSIMEKLGIEKLSEYNSIFNKIATEKDVNIKELLIILWVCYNQTGEFVSFEFFKENLDTNQYSFNDLISILFKAYEKSNKKKKTILSKLMEK